MKIVMPSVVKQLFLFVLFTYCYSFSFSQQWTQVASPNPSPVRNILRGISGTSASDIWAVGHKQTSSQMAQFTSESLIMHWNGSSWQQFNAPKLGNNMNDLYDVEMISTKDGWAVGDYDIDGSGQQPQLLRWNGTAWTSQTVPDRLSLLALWSLDAISPTDIWAVGHRSNNRALSLHYNGSNWAEIFVPQVGTFRNRFNSVHGISANDAWAVGTFSNGYGDFHFLAMHWNGKTWVNTPLTSAVSSDEGELLDVKMVSANNVWAVGNFSVGGIAMLHWDGTAWSQVSTPGGGGAFAVLNANDIYAVGNNIVHWDGSTWKTVDNLAGQSYPALTKTVVLPTNEIWAAGRTVDLNNVFKTLVYRRLATTPQDTAKISVVGKKIAVDCSNTNSLTYKCTGSTLPYTVQLYRFGVAHGSPRVVNDTNTFKFINLPHGYYEATAVGAGASNTQAGKSKPVVLTPVPANLGETNITATGARLTWQAQPCVSYYNVQYRIKGVQTWTSKQTTGNVSSLTLQKLTSGKMYEWRVAPADTANGIVGMGIYSVLDSFRTTTASLNTTFTSKSASSAELNNANTYSVAVYPNPASTQFTLRQGNLSTTGLVAVTLKDLNGRIVWKRNNVYSGSTIIVDVSKLPAGLYLLQISDKTNSIIVNEKVAVSR